MKLIRKTIKVESLSSIENLKNSEKVVLCLDSKFFINLKIEIDRSLNEEDKKEKVDDILEIIYPRYNEDDYIQRYESIREDSKKEELVVYLLDLKLLNDYIIIDDMKDYSFISIIPSFFNCRENKNTGNYINIDVGENFIVISQYKNKKIVDIDNFKINKSTLFNEEMEENIKVEDEYEIINTYLHNTLKDTEIIFTGNELDYKKLELENKSYCYLKNDRLSYKNYINFLPDELRKKYFLYFMNTIYLYIFLFLSIVTLILMLSLNYFIEKKEIYLEKIERSNNNIEDEINAMREEMIKIENSIEEIKQKNIENSNKDFKIGEFLEKFSNICPTAIGIKSINYDDKNILNIEGKSENVSSVIELMKNLNESKNFKVINYDYIINNKNIIDFEVEVKFMNEK